MSLTAKEKREYAFLLYKDGSFTQKMIAEKVGAAEKTISEWKQKDNWDAKVKSIKQTREENLMELHNQWAAINLVIRNDQKGVPNASQADIIKKLAASIRDLENEVGYTEAYQVLKKMMIHIQKMDHDKAKELIPFVDSFMQELLKYAV